MNKLQELDRSDVCVVTYQEVLEIMQEESIDFLMKYKFKNPILMSAIWHSIILEPGISDTPKGRLYLFLTRIGYTGEVPSDFTQDEIESLWNLPEVIRGRLLQLINPKAYSLIACAQDKDSIQELITELRKYPDCNVLSKSVSVYELTLEGILKKERLAEESKVRQEILDSHKIHLKELPNQTVVKSLLILNGYHGSIFGGLKLEKLMWMATGFRLIDIIKDVHKYIKIRDEIVCELYPEFESAKDVDYDYQHYGLSNSKIYEFYLNECKEIMQSTGRVENMYPGYSLSTLKSSYRAPINTPTKRKFSEFEILQFLNNNLNSEFEWIEVKEYIEPLTKLGVTPRAKDEGEGYSGFLIDQESVPTLIRMLSKYELTEFQEIRKVLSGCIDDVIKVSKLSPSEIAGFDSDLACQMVERLLELDEISYDQLMGDMKWLRLVGHIGVSLRKVAKGMYKVQFNTVDFLRVVELIHNSDLGYSVARKVLERLGSTKPFYRDVLVDFNPAIWNLHKCQMRLKYE